MKKIILFCFLIFSIVSYSQKSRLQVIFDYKQFSTPYGATYVETYLSFIASSLYYTTNSNGNLQSNLLVTQLFKQNNKIIDYKKYEVLGPELIDSIAVGFTEQERFQLQPGVYTMELEVMDYNDPDSTFISSSQVITISEIEQSPAISDIELIDYFKKTTKTNKFSKSGYDLYPLVSNYLPTEIEKLAYYFELYQKDSAKETYLLTQYIEEFESKKVVEKNIQRSKIEIGKIKPQIQVMDIKKLVSGNYNLVIELRNKKNELLTIKKLFFQRVNSEYKANEEIMEDISFRNLLPEDSIDISLKLLLPIASEMEKSVILAKTEGMTSQMKINYFYNFWSARNKTNPKQAWLEYKSRLQPISEKYHTKTKPGYLTDMGRVEIKYGKPDNIVNKPNNSGQYPYQIWHYYHLENKNNVVFVFYMPELIRQDYELLHSDMTGEPKNANWKQFLQVNPTLLDNIGVDVETGR